MATYSINNRKENTTSFVLNRLQENVYASVSNAGNKYDASYRKEKEAVYMGVFFFIVPVLFSFFSIIDIAKNGGADTFIKVMLVGALALRVIATKWVSAIAAEQNRTVAKWIAFSFFLPAISLIVMGLTKKLAAPVAAAKKQGRTYNAKNTFQRFSSEEHHGFQMAS